MCNCMLSMAQSIDWNKSWIVSILSGRVSLVMHSLWPLRKLGQRPVSHKWYHLRHIKGELVERWYLMDIPAVLGHMMKEVDQLEEDEIQTMVREERTYHHETWSHQGQYGTKFFRQWGHIGKFNGWPDIIAAQQDGNGRWKGGGESLLPNENKFSQFFLTFLTSTMIDVGYMKVWENLGNNHHIQMIMIDICSIHGFYRTTNMDHGQIGVWQSTSN